MSSRSAEHPGFRVEHVSHPTSTSQSRSARDSRATEADLVVVLVVVAACSDPMTSVKHSKTTTRNQAVSIGWLPTPAAQKKRLAVN